MELPDPEAPSRGDLVSRYLAGPLGAEAYGAALARSAERYAGFNLLAGDQRGGWYISNQPGFAMRPLSDGIHAVSNASLDTPWPKLRRLKEELARWCSDGETTTAALFSALADRSVAADAELPDTGVGLSRERFLSSAFISSAQYGTRCSSVLTVDAAGSASKASAACSSAPAELRSAPAPACERQRRRPRRSRPERKQQDARGHHADTEPFMRRWALAEKQVREHCHQHQAELVDRRDL
jgi:uncharacterized protein with NRDE domain